MGSKLNQLLKKWPADTVALQSWLRDRGISKDLTRVYCNNGWLIRVGRGAYARAGDTVDWKGAIFALQEQARLPIWPGGLSALSLSGFAHYLPMAKETLWLFGDPGTRLPAWFRAHDWRVHIKFQAPHLFEPRQLDLSTRKFANFTIKLASPERAVFELLYLVPNRYSFEFAAVAMQGLLNLRPEVMQLHLQACRSVKVKRLLLFLADYYAHPWLQRANVRSVQLGSGKRQIVKGGRLDSRYQITVPKEFDLGS